MSIGFDGYLLYFIGLLAGTAALIMTGCFLPNCELNVVKKVPLLPNLADTHLREIVTRIADTATIPCVMSVTRPMISVAIRGVMKIPEPMVDPVPRLMSSSCPSNCV